MDTDLRLTLPTLRPQSPRLAWMALTPADPGALPAAETPSSRPSTGAQARGGDDAPNGKPFRPWVPIRSLSARHRDRILAHLLALNAEDRYLRFGYPATDSQIGAYVDRLDFDRDHVIGIFNRKLQLIALAHLAYLPEPVAIVPGAPKHRVAEFGGSVARHARGRGYGARLFEHAMLDARNHGVNTLFIHALSENTAMLKIARQAGGHVTRSGSESDAYVELAPDTWASRLEQWLGEGAALVDFGLKAQTHHVERLLGKATEGAIAGDTTRD